MEEGLRIQLKQCEYFVQATKFEQYCLWREFDTQYAWKPLRKDCLHFVTPQSGTHVTFSFALINRRIVCFYTTTSAQVDWDDVLRVLEPFIKVDRHCTAINFHPATLTINQ